MDLSKNEVNFQDAYLVILITKCLTYLFYNMVVLSSYLD